MPPAPCSGRSASAVRKGSTRPAHHHPARPPPVLPPSAHLALPRHNHVDLAGLGGGDVGPQGGTGQVHLGWGVCGGGVGGWLGDLVGHLSCAANDPNGSAFCRVSVYMRPACMPYMQAGSWAARQHRDRPCPAPTLCACLAAVALVNGHGGHKPCALHLQAHACAGSPAEPGMHVPSMRH